MNVAVDVDRRPLVVRLMPVLDFGGAESRIVLQSRMASRRPYRLRVVTLHKAGAAAQLVREAGVQVDELGLSPSIRDIRTTMRLARHLGRLRPRIVHASVGEAIIHGLVAARLARVPVRIAEEVGMPDHSARLRPVMSVLYRTATRIVGVTQAVCRYLIEQDGAPENLVVHTYTCADPSFFPEPRRSAAPPRPDQPFRILHVGRLDPVKNQRRLLEAFAHAWRRESRLRLTILGEGAERPHLEGDIARLDLKDAVELPGFASNIGDHLLRSHLFVLPSLSEGCSISMIEALSTGVPVVASRVGGNVEVLGDHARHWTVPPTDVPGLAKRMLEMARLDPTQWCDMGRWLQDRAYTSFSPSAYMDRLDHLYDEASRAAGLDGLKAP